MCFTEWEVSHYLKYFEKRFSRYTNKSVRKSCIVVYEFMNFMSRSFYYPALFPSRWWSCNLTALTLKLIPAVTTIMFSSSTIYPDASWGSFVAAAAQTRPSSSSHVKPGWCFAPMEATTVPGFPCVHGGLLHVSDNDIMMNKISVCITDSLCGENGHTTHNAPLTVFDIMVSFYM